MATVKIPDAVIQVLAKMAADVVANVVKQLAEDITIPKNMKRTVIGIPCGYELRMRFRNP